MRITGGVARGIRLKTVDEEILRPATDYIRQAVFSSLGECVHGAVFLDLFAGLGSYGLEAWSRGAAYGLFIENNPKVASALETNCDMVRKNISSKENCRIWHADVNKVEIYEKFDLIFIDPPYAFARESGLEFLSKTLAWLKRSEKSRIIFEMPMDVHLPVPEGMIELKRIEKKGRNSPAATIYGLSDQ